MYQINGQVAARWPPLLLLAPPHVKLLSERMRMIRTDMRCYGVLQLGISYAVRGVLMGRNSLGRMNPCYCHRCEVQLILLLRITSTSCSVRFLCRCSCCGALVGHLCVSDVVQDCVALAAAAVPEFSVQV